MEYFIQEGELLVLRHEHSGGIIPSSKQVKDRWKLVKSGLASIVKEDFFKSEKKKDIRRKK